MGREKKIHFSNNDDMLFKLENPKIHESVLVDFSKRKKSSNSSDLMELEQPSQVSHIYGSVNNMAQQNSMQPPSKKVSQIYSVTGGGIGGIKVPSLKIICFLRIKKRINNRLNQNRTSQLSSNYP